MEYKIFIPFLIFIIFDVLTNNKKNSINAVLEIIVFSIIILFYSFINPTYGYIICIPLLFYLFYKNTINRKPIENMKIIIEKNEEDYFHFIENSVIPLNLFQTWHTKKLPPKMKECTDKLRKENPEFQYFLFDDDDCRKFIKENFDENVLYAFDNLIPGAYKADLWRYCILYKKGGIYLDIKFQCENGFKLIELLDREYLVLDRPYSDNLPVSKELDIINNKDYYKNIYKKIDSKTWQNKNIGIYNAVMVCKPNDNTLLRCINKIVEYVKNKNYGYNPLYITGPGLLGDIYFNYNTNDNSFQRKIKDFELFNSLTGNYILNRKGKILSHYKEYRYEQQQFSDKKYYQTLWKERKVFGN
jgi:mannosyltransferase OCH1-like enzyme